MSARRVISFCLLSIAVLLLTVTIAYTGYVTVDDGRTIEKNSQEMMKGTTPPSPTFAAPLETRTPVAVQTPIAPITTAKPSDSIPFMVVALAGTGVFIGVSLKIRRWWIRRQNPARIRDYDSPKNHSGVRR